MSLRSPEEMAAVFKRNKAKIEAYFSKQDLAAIIPELRLEYLISSTEEHEINSTESTKRAHTLTKILESKIVNNPDLFQNLKQFLGSSFEDFSETPQPETSTTIVPSSPSSDGEPSEISQRAPTDLEYISETWPQQYANVSLPTRQSVHAHQWYGRGWQGEHDLSIGNFSDQAPYHRYTASSSTSTFAGLHTSQPRSMQATNSRQKFPKSSVSTSKTKKQPPQRSDKAFPGIEFSSYRSRATVGHRGHTIRGEGVQLRIPPKAIKRRTSLEISLQGCISGPFSLPEGIQLASPVFLVKCTPQYQFQRELMLTMHHFVLLQNHEQCEDMVLLMSPERKVEDKDYIYWKFDFCDQPLQCFPHASYGEVELTHFSFFCFGIRLHRGKPRGFISLYYLLLILLIARPVLRY